MNGFKPPDSFVAVSLDMLLVQKQLSVESGRSGVLLNRESMTRAALVLKFMILISINTGKADMTRLAIKGATLVEVRSALSI